MTMTHEAENIELAALRAMHETTPPAGRAALGLALHELDGVTMSVATRAPSILINRAIGLGLGLGLLSSARITIWVRRADSACEAASRWLGGIIHGWTLLARC